MTRYDRWRASLEPAMGHELNKFIGTTLKGKAHMPLGIVAAADRTTGSVGVVGRHGEVAQIHNSLLYRDGAVLRAPDLTYGDIARASAHRRPLVRPEIIIEEIPAR
jgi:hypothetical protein